LTHWGPLRKKKKKKKKNVLSYDVASTLAPLNEGPGIYEEH